MHALVIAVPALLIVALAAGFSIASEHVGFLSRFIDWVLDMGKLNDD